MESPCTFSRQCRAGAVWCHFTGRGVSLGVSRRCGYVERIFLTDAQVDQIEELSRADVDTKLYARYVARQNGAVIGRAYVDTHQVRTKKGKTWWFP
ncbi:MAG: hypothetical protein CM1200mP25_0390 [Acidobacteriota bacterium]|nr:MAG: hypothetical protein CM1200mP25_0390 [Acidobacteriota bacterium]